MDFRTEENHQTTEELIAEISRTIAEELDGRDCRRILVGMSGGLDSTTTAFLLKRMGYEVGGAVLKMFPEMDTTAAYEAARQVGIPLIEVDAAADFEQYVIGDFLHEYAHGRTPNPCVCCNRFVKVKKLCDAARENGYDHIATGHYAHIAEDARSGRWYVHRAGDAKKDQSYVLWRVRQEELSMLVTPLCDARKPVLREIASRLGFTCAASKESQDICFIPDGDYISFVEQRLGAFPDGDFVNETGEKVGTHHGVIRYTIGQRKKLGLSMGHPVFISHIDKENNRITIKDAGDVYGDTLRVSHLCFQKLSPPTAVYTVADGDCIISDGITPTAVQDEGWNGDKSVNVRVKIRYAAPAVSARLTVTDDGQGIVNFSAPVRAVTPGQSAVFYDEQTGEDVLGGGIIEE